MLQQVGRLPIAHEKAAAPKGRRKFQWRELSIWVAARPIQQWRADAIANALSVTESNDLRHRGNRHRWTRAVLHKQPELQKFIARGRS